MSHKAAHFVTGIAVVAAAGASTLAATYTVSKASFPSPVLELAMVTAAVLTASLALMPMFLAPAYGDAIRKGAARKQLLGLTIGVLLVDGAMQMNAVSVASKAMGVDHLNHVAAGIVIAAFQLSTFFIRGALIEAHNERQAVVAAEKLAIAQQAVELEKLAAKKEKNRRAAKRRKAKAAAAAKAAGGDLRVLKGGKS